MTVRLLLFLSLLSPCLWAQRPDSSLHQFRSTERALQELQQRVFFSRSEKDRFEANKDFIELWERLVHDPAALKYPFDSLREVSRLTTEDQRVRVITWNIPGKDGQQFYFGYVLALTTEKIRKGLFHHERVESYQVFPLQDRSQLVKNPETYIGTPEKWFGMLYTAMVECDKYILLLGWDGNSNITQRKFIDVMSFRGDGTPVFGKSVFKIPRKNPKRMMFEYGTGVTMSLRYHESNNMIIFNHLSAPLEGGNLEGQYQYYGPDGSYDALVYKDHQWVLTEDVDVRNARNRGDNPKKPDTKKHKKFLPGQKTP